MSRWLLWRSAVLIQGIEIQAELTCISFSWLNSFDSLIYTSGTWARKCSRIRSYPEFSKPLPFLQIWSPAQLIQHRIANWWTTCCGFWAGKTQSPWQSSATWPAAMLGRARRYREWSCSCEKQRAWRGNCTQHYHITLAPCCVPGTSTGQKGWWDCHGRDQHLPLTVGPPGKKRSASADGGKTREIVYSCPCVCACACFSLCSKSSPDLHT